MLHCIGPRCFYGTIVPFCTIPFSVLSFSSDFRTFIEPGCFSLLFCPSIYYRSYSRSYSVYAPHLSSFIVACNIRYIFFVCIRGLYVEERFAFFLWDLEDYAVLVICCPIPNPIHILATLSCFRPLGMHVHCIFLLAIVAYLLMPLCAISGIKEISAAPISGISLGDQSTARKAPSSFSTLKVFLFSAEEAC